VEKVLDVTDRSYLIKDGVVLCHGTPLQLVHDPVASKAYFSKDFAREFVLKSGGGAADHFTEAAPLKSLALAEAVRRLVEHLATANHAAAAAELRRHGPSAVPALL